MQQQQALDPSLVPNLSSPDVTTRHSIQGEYTSYMKDDDSESVPVADAASKIRRRKSFIRKITLCGVQKSLNIPAILLIVFTIPSSFLYGVSLLALDVIFSPQEGCTINKEFQKLSLQFDLAFILQNIAVFVMFPFAGWLSDTKLGRYRTIYYSLWFMWVGTGTIAVSFVFRHSIHPCDKDDAAFYLGKYAFPILGVIIISIGAAMYFPNVLAFIMEHLMEMSNSMVRSYIYWFVWALFVGFFFSDWVNAQLYIDLSLTDLDKWFIFPIMISLVFFSGALIVCFFYEKSFHTQNLKKNPYGVAYRVACFAAKHKNPVNRSAMTYHEDKLPSRFDLGKEKYGGPFKHEEVEDVKTLYRMILFFFSFLPFFIAYDGPLSQLVSFILHIQQSEDNVSVWFLYLSESSITIITIPILELVILPLFPKFEYFLQNPLRWMFGGMIALTLSSISLFIIDLIGHLNSTGPSSSQCFINSVVAADNLGIDYRWVVIPILLWGVCDLLISTSILTFICSQAPYTMNGMLLGLFMFFQGAFKAIGDFVGLAFSSSNHYVWSCGIWYWLTLALVAIVGCIFFLVFAKYYKLRMRWEAYRYHEVIENIYERQLEVDEGFTFSKLTETVVDSA